MSLVTLYGQITNDISKAKADNVLVVNCDDRWKLYQKVNQCDSSNPLEGLSDRYDSEYKKVRLPAHLLFIDAKSEQAAIRFDDIQKIIPLSDLENQDDCKPKPKPKPCPCPQKETDNCPDTFSVTRNCNKGNTYTCTRDTSSVVGAKLVGNILTATTFTPFVGSTINIAGTYIPVAGGWLPETGNVIILSLTQNGTATTYVVVGNVVSFSDTAFLLQVIYTNAIGVTGSPATGLGSINEFPLTANNGIIEVTALVDPEVPAPVQPIKPRTRS